MNAVERAVVLSRSEYLSENDFPIVSAADIGNDEAVSDTTKVNISGKMPLEEVEKATILKTLQAAGGNKSEAARRLGITRKTLHKKLKAYGVMK
jgi:two-component system response regulator HydG